MQEDLNKKYGLNPAHSEVVAACQTIQPCKVLETGCSNGRNALYLAQLGFDVTAVDINAQAVATLEKIAQAEHLTNIRPRVYDLNEAQLPEAFDFIISTVTLMFLDPNKIQAVISNMQQQTNQGGYHLIVCAMDTQATPSPVQFPFTFKEGELKSLYKGWELLKYNENMGTMHHGAQLQFATLLAKKT